MSLTCEAALGELDDALEELLSVLDEAGDARFEDLRARTDACFAAFTAACEAEAVTADSASDDLRYRLEGVLAKYALASNLAQRWRSDLAQELEALRAARHRLAGAKGAATTGEECDVRG